MSTKTAPRVVAALVASLLLLAGCTGPTATTTSGGEPGVAPAPMGVPAEDAKSLPASGVGDVAAEREVARTASITLVVARPSETAERVRQVAAQFDGFITREDVYSTELSNTSTLVLSVPAERVDAVLSALAGLGTMTSRSSTATDVTDRVVDVDARIRTLQDSIARIRALLDRAGSVTEIAAVERELTSRQSELESLLAQQKNLRNRVDRTPVTVSLTTKTPADPNPFLDGLRAAWEALQGSLRAMLVGAGALLPFVALAALVFFPVRAWLRGRRRPAPHRPTAAASEGTPQPPTD